jgi:hypothetical protein
MIYDALLSTGDCETSLYLGCEHCEVCEVETYTEYCYNEGEIDEMEEWFHSLPPHVRAVERENNKYYQNLLAKRDRLIKLLR